VLTVSRSPINADLATANMELMIHTLGLGACYSGYTTYGLANNEAAREFLGVKEGYKVQTCLYFGRPNVKYERTAPRKAPRVRFM